MAQVSMTAGLILAAILFLIGLVGVLTRRNIIFIYYKNEMLH